MTDPENIPQNQMDPSTQEPDSHNQEQPLEEGRNEHHKRRHENHSVSRRYRMYSNHSSANDMPRTDTSY